METITAQKSYKLFCDNSGATRFQFRRHAIQRWTVSILLISLALTGIAILFLKSINTLIEVVIALFVGLIGVRTIVLPYQFNFISLIDVFFFVFYLLIIFTLVSKILVSRSLESRKRAEEHKTEIMPSDHFDSHKHLVSFEKISNPNKFQSISFLIFGILLTAIWLRYKKQRRT